MFSGNISKRSEKVIPSSGMIYADADILVITGTTAIVNIVARTGGVAAQELTIIPLGALTCTAAGNISVAVTFVANRATKLVWSRTQNKWYPQIAAV